jgi:hypothetical protein
MNAPLRRHVEPLPAPPGAFDTVLGRARARRYRRLTAVASVTGVFLAGIFGGLAMGGGVSGVQQSLYQFASGNDAATQSPSSTTTTSAASVARKSKRPHSARPSVSTAPVVGRKSRAAHGPQLRVRGQVVDESGSPVAGMYVYTGVSTQDGFVPSATAAAVTSVTGHYAIPCRKGSVLLTSWPLNTPLGATADGRWAATFVAAPVCARNAPAEVTSVSKGATIEGTVRTDVSCPDQNFPLWVWLGGDRTASVRLSHLSEGDRFRVSGLPAGTQVLGARGRHLPVTVASSSITQDVEFACTGIPTPTDTPTVSPSPIPTPSETESPPPTESTAPVTGTPSPTPSPTGSASSSRAR